MDEPRRRRIASAAIAADSADVEAGSATTSRSVRQKKQPKKKRNKRRKNKSDVSFTDPSFWVIFGQVAIALLLILIICFGTFRLLHPTSSIRSHYALASEEEELVDDFNRNDEIEEEEEEADVIIEPPTAPPLPDFTLTGISKYDAFGLLQLFTPASSSSSRTTDSGNTAAHDKFWNIAKTLRDEFAHRHGGEISARAMLERGLWTAGANANETLASTTTSSLFSLLGGGRAPYKLPSDLIHTACRFQSTNDFKIAFGGYSVTTGRGNYFHQSYPFVLQTKLEPLFNSIGIELEVRNAAIGGVPSFPYAWCFENFWGTQANVVSWDYSMNEAGGVVAEGMEAYTRNIMQTMEHAPKLIALDTHMASNRRQLLKSYVDSESPLVDPVVLHIDPAVAPFLSILEERRPVAFRDWRKFGAPPGAPGQAAHHPAKKEHEVLGWMLAMHFLAAMELHVLSREGSVDLTCPSRQERTLPPKPLTVNKTSALLFTDPKFDTQCRTSFEPIVSGDLKEIVGNNVIDDGDLLMPKGAMFYNQGWVLDLTESERLAKKKLDRFGGLGFVDSKKAYFGTYHSGSITFLLPLRSQVTSNLNVNDVLGTIVLCQVNDKERHPKACQADTQLNYWIAGQNVTSATMIDAPGTLYLGHKLCVQLEIPNTATVSTGSSSVNLTAQVVDKHIIKKDLACSISHVIWQEEKSLW